MDVEEQLAAIETKLEETYEEIYELYEQVLHGDDEPETGENLDRIVGIMKEYFESKCRGDIYEETLEILVNDRKFKAAQVYYDGNATDAITAIDNDNDIAKWMSTHPNFERAKCVDNLLYYRIEVTADNYELLSSIFTPDELANVPGYDAMRAEVDPLVKSAACGV